MILTANNELFLIPIGLLVIGYICYGIIKKAKAYKSLYNTLVEIAGNENVKEVKNKAFDYEVHFDDKTYLVKMIYHPNTYEININAIDYWQVNRGAVSSRKSGEKMSGVYDLINFDLEKNGYAKNTIKLYVIYPFSRTLLKVLNECEYEFIKPHTDIYGCKLTNYRDLKDNFSKF